MLSPAGWTIFSGSMERTFLLSLEFDGTGFCGWQRQTEGRSVQHVMEEAVSRLAGGPRRVVGAGRTDAGVHALALPASVTMPTRWTTATLLRALNAVLPSDVAVRRVQQVVPGTDARRSALSRRYRYDLIEDASGRSPFVARTTWPLGYPLDLAALTEATEALAGRHDFRAFAVVGEPKPHYDCAIREARWERLDASRLRFHIMADRFLHRMVRLLVGTLVEIGRGRRPVSDMTRLLARTDNAETGPPAPASGLAFVAAEYPAACFLEECAAW